MEADEGAVVARSVGTECPLVGKGARAMAKGAHLLDEQAVRRASGVVAWPRRDRSMGSGRGFLVPTVCVRDDDAKTFEFRTSSDSTEIVDRVSAAIANGRHVRCYMLGADKEVQEMEERYLTGRGIGGGACRCSSALSERLTHLASERVRCDRLLEERDAGV